ncbi:L-seryl-tRNA(Sec) selenium transferase [Gemmatimonadetes bacterium T265]|nr:L-seryl-tRNA(Sec) selenium transferase [Gemmatimonadetes bacterium T265]
MTDHPLAHLPSVDEVLRHPAFAAAAAGLADPFRTRLVRRVLQARRDALRDPVRASAPAPARRNGERAAVVAACVAECAAEAEALARPFPRRVVNATGVLVHTNLGRAPLGDLLDAVDADALGGYTDLEWDARTQGRGDRDAALGRQLALLTGAEAALVVNNCASALLLALNTLAAGREALVSRSELVEIGGSFRVPDVVAASGCRLREVGTTNRTRAADFREAAGPSAAVLLKVHQANFVQRGFVEQVSADEMVALGAAFGLPVLEDTGSGLLAPSPAAALRDEPDVASSVARGVDVVCCSADKLLGGVQAGILVGRAAHVGAMRRNPLYRALRLDKVRMALLHRCLARHLAGEADALPLWRLFHATVEQLQARVAELRLPGPDTRWAAVRPVPLRATLGGGSNPEVDFPSWGLELAHRDLSAHGVRQALAARAVPVVGYVRHDRCLLDVRAVLPHDLPELQAALDDLGAAAGR